jgi:prolipoprotein diacylglyceryltransferase
MPRSSPDGAIFGLYAIGYAIGRLILSPVRQETVVIGNFQQAQVIGIAFIVVALGILAARH